MENDHIILAFKGELTEELLTSVFQMMESRLEDSAVDLKVKKKVNNILVECLQNVYHHMEGFLEEEKTDDSVGSVMFLICQDQSQHFRIVTGNHMLNSNVAPLKKKIDDVNGMNEEELKTHYIERLKNSELSDKGGAGLGMIDMARKSGNKLEYHFDHLNERISFFSLIVHVG